MKKQIRRNVFETNSSSMHSLSIIGSDRMVQLTGENDVVSVGYGEFGWGYDRLNSPREKISYLITQYSENDDMIDRIKDAVKDYTGFVLNIVEGNEDDWDDGKGYIDHQSQGMICEFISDKQSIIDIVFNEKYTIIIDNDNH